MINKGKVLNLGKLKNTNFLSKNKYLIIICIMYFTGIVCSVVFYKSKLYAFNWQGITDYFYLGRAKYNFIKIYARSFLGYLSVLALFFMSGASVTGVGTVPVVTFALGLYMGGLTSYFYVTYSLKGIAYNALLIMPADFIFVIICFLAAKFAMEYSNTICAFASKKAFSANNALSFKAYGKAYLFLIIAVLIVSLLDTVLSVLFIGLFNF